MGAIEIPVLKSPLSDVYTGIPPKVVSWFKSPPIEILPSVTPAKFIPTPTISFPSERVTFACAIEIYAPGSEGVTDITASPLLSEVIISSFMTSNGPSVMKLSIISGLGTLFSEYCNLQ